MPDPADTGAVPPNLLGENLATIPNLGDNLPENLGGVHGVEGLSQNGSDSTETTDLEKIVQYMRTAERDFWRALPQDFLIKLDNLDPVFRSQWLRLSIKKANKYMDEWEQGSRHFLNLTENYDRDVKRCDAQLDQMISIIMLANNKLSELVETENKNARPAPSQPGTPPSQQPNQPTSTTMVKLDLASFSGRNALDFLPWYQAFKASVLDTKLPAVQKMIYLNHYCTGPARAAIEQFQLTEENLQPAIQTLKDRFNRPDQILNGTFNKIIAIPRLPSNSDTFQLRRFFDTITTSLSIIKSQDNSYENQPHLLLCAIKAKIPASVLRDFERHRQQAILQTPTQADNTKTLQFFMDFLKLYVKTEEVINDRDLLASKKEFSFVKSNNSFYKSDNRQDYKSKPTFYQPDRDKNGVPRPRNSTGHTFVTHKSNSKPHQPKKATVNTVQTKNHTPCFFCAGSHPSRFCKLAATDSLKAFNKAAEAKVCKKCFDHPYNVPCPFPNIKCNKCSRTSHNQLVCVPVTHLNSKFNNKPQQPKRPIDNSRKQ